MSRRSQVVLLLVAAPFVIGAACEPVVGFTIRNPCDKAVRARAQVVVLLPHQIDEFALKRIPPHGEKSNADANGMPLEDSAELVIQDANGDRHIVPVEIPENPGDPILLTIPDTWCNRV
jgi:hypothetical protein